MADSMDSLSIEITQDTSDAVNGVELLQKSLENLKRATKGGVGLNAVINQLKAFDDVSKDTGKNLSKVDFESFTKNVKKLSTALQPLQGFKTQATGLINSLRGFKDTAEEFNEFTDFGAFSSQVRRLATSLEPLNNISGKLGATLRALEQLPMIGQQLQTTNFTEFATNIQTLTNSLVPLSTVQSKLGSTLNQLSRFSQISQQLGITMVDTNVATNIKNLVEALRPLSEMGKSQLGSFLNQLKKLPEIMQSLSDMDMDAFAAQIKRVTDAIRPLANEMNKVAAGFNAFPIRIRKIIEQNEKLAASNVKTSKSFGILGTGISRVKAKMMVYVYAAKRLAGVMAEWFVESNAYVENLNLFRVSMREASEEALDYANKVYDAFGVDPSEWIRYQAVFQNMATGFGIASDKATIMSKSLTQLGYDLATIFNVDYSVAMQKLQSAIAGQPRPMREWGFDMSETTLKMVALNHGIKENVELMTQNEKAQLRFIQLMETAKKQGILGNFAREIHTPANAFRILNQQILMFRRALGDMMIPIIIKVLPYVQAFVKVLTDAARALAALFRFELPLIDYSGLGDLPAITDDIEDGFDDATGAAKAFRKQLAGFDELNILNKPDASAVGAIGIGDLGLDLSPYDYNFLGEGLDTRVAEIAENIKQHLEPLIPFFEGLANIIKPFLETLKKFYDDKLYPWLVRIGDWMAENPELLKKLGEGLGYVAIGLAGFKALKFLADITGISKLVRWLWSLWSVTGRVNQGFGDKNKLLGEQTKATDLETSSVIGLAGAFGLALWGLKKLKEYLDENPIKLPELELPQPVPAPAFEPLPNPIWEPNYGLEGVPVSVKAPEFDPIPDPVWEPNWNIAESLITATGLGLIAFGTFKGIITTGMGELATSISTSASTLKESVVTSVSEMFTKTSTVLGNLKTNAAENIKSMKETLVTNAQETWDNVSYAFSAMATSAAMSVYQFAINGIGNLNAFFSSTYSSFTSWVHNSVSGLAEWGTGMISTIAETARGMVESLVSGLSSMWDKLKEYAKAAGEKISGVFRGDYNLPSPKTITAIGVSIAGLVLTMGGLVPPAMSFGAYAKGGIIDRPTLALMGERGREAVVPLENNTGWITELASKITERSGTNGNMTIIVKVGEDTLTEKVVSNINRQSRISGETVIEI